MYIRNQIIKSNYAWVKSEEREKKIDASELTDSHTKNLKPIIWWRGDTKIF